MCQSKIDILHFSSFKQKLSAAESALTSAFYPNRTIYAVYRNHNKSTSAYTTAIMRKAILDVINCSLRVTA